ncbi:hypothetical protein LINGRAHAP2_LOCUS14729 [Linum grandiflorum]
MESCLYSKAHLEPPCESRIALDFLGYNVQSERWHNLGLQRSLLSPVGVEENPKGS